MAYKAELKLNNGDCTGDLIFYFTLERKKQKIESNSRNKLEETVTDI